MNRPTISETVWAFLDKASPMVGRMQEERWRIEMQGNCLEVGMSESPIEHLFWIACQTLCEAYYVNLNPDPEFDANGQPYMPGGTYLRPQVSLGRYRVDFLLTTTDCLHRRDVCQPLVVELDGHDFHDKDKRQRSYEKQRDRELVRGGFRVIHFTGSDVVKDPFACAFEALQMVQAVDADERYDAADPLGLNDA